MRTELVALLCHQIHLHLQQHSFKYKQADIRLHDLTEDKTKTFVPTFVCKIPSLGKSLLDLDSVCEQR